MPIRQRTAVEVEAITLASGANTGDLVAEVGRCLHSPPCRAKLLGVSGSRPLRHRQRGPPSGSDDPDADTTHRSLHGPRQVSTSSHLGLADECDWLVANNVLPADIVIAQSRPRRERRSGPTHRCLSTATCIIEHVFVDGDTVSGIIDWSEARQGDALFDIASLTLANEEHLDDVIAGYGVDVDRDLVRAWWSWRCLVVVRWLFENGYGSPEQYPEVAVLRSQL